MLTEIVLTLTGPDRVGIVEEFTREVLALDGNVGTSRMARLGGAFAILMLVTLPVERVDDLEGAFGSLAAAGFKVTVTPTRSAAAAPAAGTRYRIGVRGADHEGIVHGIAAGLAASGVNIDELETDAVPAPTTGTPIFSMDLLVSVREGTAEDAWRPALEDAAREADVDVTVEPADI
ncbi:MAG: transcriptional regulator [Actinobacteria bacterium]|nr:MAG: transcriptional regulator [Actinomycetota bacterium]